MAQPAKLNEVWKMCVSLQLCPCCDGEIIQRLEVEIGRLRAFMGLSPLSRPD